MHPLFISFSALCILLVNAEFRAEFSAEAPFDKFDTHGSRIVSNYEIGGSATAMKQFLRITPDRASKRGWLWAHKPLNLQQWSVILKFRISGQGKSLFGDGLALWFTTDPHHVPGELHGNREDFTGLGVIFDTFRNIESASTHRDVTLIWNDGTKSTEAMLQDLHGCDIAGMRYHEQRADFSVANSSRARITWLNGELRVDVDARSDGSWVQCGTILTGFSPQMLMHINSDGRLGVTATTGQLADNHDVVAVRVYDNPADTESAQCAAAEASNAGVEHIVHDLEHKVIGLIDGLRNAVTKLAEQERAAESRITDIEGRVIDSASSAVQKRLEELEHKIHEFAEGHVDQRIKHLEEQLNSKAQTSLENRLRHLEAEVDHRMVRRVEQLEDKFAKLIDHTVAGKIGMKWHVPFTVLIVFFIVFAVAVFLQFRKNKKNHIF